MAARHADQDRHGALTIGKRRAEGSLRTEEQRDLGDLVAVGGVGVGVGHSNLEGGTQLCFRSDAEAPHRERPHCGGRLSARRPATPLVNIVVPVYNGRGDHDRRFDGAVVGYLRRGASASPDCQRTTPTRPCSSTVSRARHRHPLVSCPWWLERVGVFTVSGGPHQPSARSRSLPAWRRYRPRPGVPGRSTGMLE